MFWNCIIFLLLISLRYVWVNKEKFSLLDSKRLDTLYITNQKLSKVMVEYLPFCHYNSVKTSKKKDQE